MQGMRTLGDRCQASFTKSAWAKGEDYYRRRRVSLYEVDAEGAFAEVRDLDGNCYDVEVQWTPGESFIDAECSCQRGDGFLCKHVAAVIHALDHNRDMPVLPGNGNLKVVPTQFFYDDPLSTAEQRLTTKAIVAPHIYSPPTEPPRNQRRQQPPAWHSALQAFAKAVKRPPTPRRSTNNARQKLYYVVNLVDQYSQTPLRIQLVKRAVKRTGELGVPKSWRVGVDDIADFPEPADRELLLLLLGSSSGTGYYGGYGYRYGARSKDSACEISSAVYSVVLPRLSATGRFGWRKGFHLSSEEIHPLQWDDGSPWKLKLALSAPNGKARRLVAKLYRDGEERELSEAVGMFAGCVLFADRLAALDPSVNEEALKLLDKARSIEVPLEQEDRFVEEVWQTQGLPAVELPDDLKWEQIRNEPHPQVMIGPVRIGAMTWLIGKLRFDYGGLLLDSQDQRRAICDRQQRRIIHRHEQKEQAAMDELMRLGAQPTAGSETYHGTFKVSRKEFAPLVAALNDAGWHVEAEGYRIRRPGTTHVSLASGVDWFELDGHVDYDGEEVGLPKLLEALRRGEDFVTLGDGSRGMLPAEWLARYAPLAEMGEAEGDKLRFKPSQAMLLDAWLAAQPEVDVDAAFDHVRQRLRSFEGVRPHEEPAGFSGVLRPYQRDGLGWLLFLEDFGFGGCLADDMGLGKTIQVLAMLVERRNRAAKNSDRKPTLVVVPRSLVRNWVEEARKFAPQLKVLDYTGLARSDMRQQFGEHDLVVTTYGTLRRDAGELKDMAFDFAILDEAQAIKNAGSQAAKACRLIQSGNRLAMTGTPVENHLGELWSIFEFLNPGMLGRSNSLKLLASRSTATDTEGVRLLAKALRPFILRRTKEQVLKDLPEKMEQTLYCELDTPQRKLYDELRNHYREALSNRIAKEGLKKSKIHVLEALLRLRQAACHPGLLDKAKASEPSAKLETLLEQLDEVFQEGHKALVFSQFTSLLALVRQRLDERKIVYEYLDGRTRDRQRRVDRFQTDADCPLFLISLKAGGLGLNLTAADYVFILDPWWNPAVEAQAVDRAHRIGQTRRVFAYRLIARDTVEEKILQLQGEKRHLAEAIVSANDSLIGQLTADDLQVLLS